MSSPAPARLDELVAAARAVREHAHAPYSGFRVGAAVLSGDGRIFAGANVENAAYPLSVCAERSAVQRAVGEGATRLVALAVAGPGPGATWPCGGCRQVLHEFGPDALVVVEAEGGQRAARPLAELLPQAFGAGQLP